MLGKEENQKHLWAADALYADKVGPKSFYGKLARIRSRLFTDEMFSGLYVLDNGRPSVPPSLLATARMLQSHDKVSDAEAAQRARFDLRWSVARGLEVAEQAFVKSTLQRFRSLLILHGAYRQIFLASLKAAEEAGLFGTRYGRTVALDTTPVFGKGAVKDTYNLLADGMRKLMSALARSQGMTAKVYAKKHGYERYYGTSIKGESEVDWSDEASINTFLTSLVHDALALLEAARAIRSGVKAESKADRAIAEGSTLLSALLLQDIERPEDGPCTIKRGVVKDRLLSVHDPEMRCGHKSRSTRYEGHKAAIVVDSESQVITAVEVLPGNAPDRTDALKLVEQSEKNTGHGIGKIIGDCAYGDGQTRQAFAEAGRDRVARVPKTPRTKHYAKEAFAIHLEKNTVTCPGGQTTPHHERFRKGRLFHFPDQVCAACPARASCVKRATHGRTVFVHPQESLLQKARAYQKTDAFTEDIQHRQTVEHRLARLKQLGMKQSRFFGKLKTKFQRMMAATVANLSLVFHRSDDSMPPLRPRKRRRSLGLVWVRRFRFRRNLTVRPYAKSPTPA